VVLDKPRAAKSGCANAGSFGRSCLALVAE
jgi:hypothetical protein